MSTHFLIFQESLCANIPFPSPRFCARMLFRLYYWLKKLQITPSAVQNFLQIGEVIEVFKLCNFLSSRRLSSFLNRPRSNSCLRTHNHFIFHRFRRPGSPTNHLGTSHCPGCHSSMEQSFTYSSLHFTVSLFLFVFFAATPSSHHVLDCY